MLPSSFASWLDHRHHSIPEADRVLPVIAQAGPRGMTRGEIGGAIQLERESLDALMDGLVQFGVLTVTWEDGVRVYRAQSL